MKPCSPVLPPCDEFVIARDQPPYKPLPAIQCGDAILTRWHMSWKERLLAFVRGDVYLYVKTFGSPLQPLLMQVEKPDFE